MKVLVFAFLLISTTSFGQLISGTAKEEGRKIISETPFVIEGTINGWAIYELAMDRQGKVLSAKLLKTNLTRTSAKMQIRNYMMTMKFTAGTIYPKYHHAQVKVELVKPLPVEEEKEEETK